MFSTFGYTPSSKTGKCFEPAWVFPLAKGLLYQHAGEKVFIHRQTA